MRIVLATRNEHKAAEIRTIFSGIDITLVSLDDFKTVPVLVEDGKSLEENALKKARAIRGFTGMSALADDSGLEVEALGGAPGIFSSRFAGERASYADNNKKLLDALSDVPEGKRAATFRCVMALALEDSLGYEVYKLLQAHCGNGREIITKEKDKVDALLTEGVVQGTIARQVRGREGFGYDPLFEVEGTGKTFAELGVEEKNRMSHRYRALVEMRALLIRFELAFEDGG